MNSEELQIIKNRMEWEKQTLENSMPSGPNNYLPPGWIEDCRKWMVDLNDSLKLIEEVQRLQGILTGLAKAEKAAFYEPNDNDDLEVHTNLNATLDRNRRMNLIVEEFGS